MSDSPDHPPSPHERAAHLQSLLDEVADLSASGPLPISERLNLLMVFVPDPQTGEQLKQPQLAEKSGVDRRNLNKIVRGKVAVPTTQTLLALANSFAVPITYFTDPDVGTVLRNELQQLHRAVDVGQRLDELGVVSANFRTAPTTAALLQRVVGLVESDGDQDNLAAANLKAVESLVTVLENANARHAESRRPQPRRT
ncbi:helix-turn-helix transcriptional regulator [Nonomuraea ceibae]|uniref:helix-turn-helix transcriptional regulator n=1 Tax=Nonomuraea ceibae TaxID=1935170 RepID=UPI001C5E25EF|nr:helix-turn-helix domain-containing protein [Nonomuraea ceibae]